MDTSFERIRTGKEEWLTPPEIIHALGKFDLDPCAPVPGKRPWATAKHHYDELDDGLTQPWVGRVWCNPPYGTKTIQWLTKLAEHDHGTALIFARTETKLFFECVWPKASALLFLRGRLRFRNVDGSSAPQCAGAPSVLVAYGETDAKALRASGIDGRVIELVVPNIACSCHGELTTKVLDNE